jgi:hypothetical protein
VLLNTEKGRPSVSPPIGERETKPWGTTGAGTRRYATMKDMPRAYTVEEADEDSRRSRPAVKTWSGSRSTSMMGSVNPPARR